MLVYASSGICSSPRTRHYASAPEAAISQRIKIRLPIQQDNILLLSMCTVEAISCCSFFPRYWLSGLQTTMLWSLMCHPDLTRHDPGVQQHSIEFCRHASSLTGTDSTFTPSRQ